MGGMSADVRTLIDIVERLAMIATPFDIVEPRA
jgi:hypothetical protein